MMDKLLGSFFLKISWVWTREKDEKKTKEKMKRRMKMWFYVYIKHSSIELLVVIQLNGDHLVEYHWKINLYYI